MSDDRPLPNVRYPRIEFRERVAGEEPWRPSWQNAIPALNATLNKWLRNLDNAPFDEIVDDGEHRWHVTGKAVDDMLEWRVTLAGYNWFCSARSSLPSPD